MLPVTHVLYLASALFLVGLATAWLRRDRMIALLGVELMLAAASLVLVAGSRYWADADGQALTVTAGIAMLAQVGVGAAMISTIRSRALAGDSTPARVESLVVEADAKTGAETGKGAG